MHYKQLLRFFIPAIVLLGVFYSACNKTDFEDAELDDHSAEFAFPLFTTTLLLEDLMVKVLNDTLSGDTLLVNPDNTMTLYYTGDVAEKPASDIFQFLQFGFIQLTDTVVTNPIQAPNGVTIREAILKSGNIIFAVTNKFSDTITGYFEIPEMTSGGVPFTYSFTVPPESVVPLWTSGPIDLSGYELNSNSNTLTFRYYAYLPDGTRVKIPNQTSGFANVYVTFLDLKFSYVEGYWGFQEYQLIRDTIEININQTELVGDVQVKNPKVTMRVSNSWGFPTRGKIKYLSFIGKNGEEIPLESSVFVDSAVDFNYPSWAANEVGQTKYTDIFLDETNSNIADIFNAQPTRLIYEVDGISNALLDPNLIGFLTDSSTIKLQMRVELLLEGSAKNFGAEQTLDLNFGDYGDLDTAKFEQVEFKLVTENGTPISAAIQLYFLDDAGIAIDSLFTGGTTILMEAAPINSEGIATGSTRTENFIPMSIARFDRVRRAKQAFLKTSFSTAQGGTIPVKLLATNEATVKMGLKVKTKY